MLHCNYETKCMDPNLSLSYKELLQYFHELTSMYGSNQERKFILWNNVQGNNYRRKYSVLETVV